MPAVPTREHSNGCDRSDTIPGGGEKLSAVRLKANEKSRSNDRVIHLFSSHTPTFGGNMPKIIVFVQKVTEFHQFYTISIKSKCLKSRKIVFHIDYGKGGTLTMFPRNEHFVFENPFPGESGKSRNQWGSGR